MATVHKVLHCLSLVWNFWVKSLFFYYFREDSITVDFRLKTFATQSETLSFLIADS